MKNVQRRAESGPVSLKATALYQALCGLDKQRWVLFGTVACGLAVGGVASAATEHTSVWGGDLALGDSIVFSTAGATGWVTSNLGDQNGTHLTAAGENLINLTNTSRLSYGTGMNAFNGGSITAANGVTIETHGFGMAGAYAGGRLQQGVPLETPVYVGTITLAKARITTDGVNSPGAIAYGYKADLVMSDSTIETRTAASNRNALPLTSTGFGVGAGGLGILTDSSVITRGINSPGLWLSAIGQATSRASTLQATGVQVKTYGDESPGFLATGGGVGSVGHADNVDITTAGQGSAGLQADGGKIEVRPGGVRLHTLGPRSTGLLVQEQTGEVDGSGKVTVTTAGEEAAGMSAENGGIAQLSDAGSSVLTSGERAIGVRAITGGQVTLNAVAVETIGAGSTVVDASGQRAFTPFRISTVTVVGGKLKSSGEAAFGVLAHDGGLVDLSGGVSVTTDNDGSHGIVAGDVATSAPSRVTVANASVLTAGVNAVGLLARSNGEITTTAGVRVDTYGEGSSGAETSNAVGTAGGTLNLADTAISTRGNDAAGIKSLGGEINVGAGVTVETFGDRSSAIVIQGPNGKSPVLDASFTAHTHGSDSHGLSVRGGANYGLDSAAGKLALGHVTIEGAGGAVVHSEDAGSVLTLGQGVNLSDATISAEGWGAKAQDGGSIIFGADSRTGGARITATGTTGVASLIFEDGSDASGAFGVLDAGGAIDLSRRSSALNLGSLAGDAGAVQLGQNDLIVGDNNSSTTYGGTINGAGGVHKVGTGTLTLRGNQVFQYGGDTDIEQGVLRLANITDTENFEHKFALKGGWLDLSSGAIGSTDTPERSWSKLNVVDERAGAAGGIIGSSDKVVYSVADGQTQSVGYTLGGATPQEQGIFVEKRGPGTLELTGVNNYAGNTRVLGGTLRIYQDANLGNSELGREVILNGGNLDVQGNVSGERRNIELGRSSEINVGDSFTASWGGVLQADGCNCVLTKTGEGTLGLGARTQVGGLLLKGGTTRVDGGVIGGAASAIASTSGTSALSLNGTRVSGSNAAVAVTAGASLSVAAAAAQIDGLMSASGANSVLNMNLSSGSVHTGYAAQDSGGKINFNLADSQSVWNITKDSSLQTLSNQGSLIFTPDAGGGHRKVEVAGNYTGGGRVSLNTYLNEGGPLANQKTDRLLVRGDVTGGTTFVKVVNSGPGANSNIGNSHKFFATEGTSLVQVGGASALNAFQLDNDGKKYVAAPGSAYQYRLFGYGPGSPYGVASQSQGLLPGQDVNWDYRLQTAYETEKGVIVPGVPDGPVDPVDPGPGPGPDPKPDPVRPLLVPQAPSYAIAAIALQRYGYFINTKLQDRLSVGSESTSGTPRPRVETYGQAIGERAGYQSNKTWREYGYAFDQTNQAIQLGTSAVVASTPSQDFRVGTAITLGSLVATPHAKESTRLKADAYSLSLTGEWTNIQGWYANGVLTGTSYRGDVYASGTKTGRVKALGLDASVEAGKVIPLSNGLELTPHLQLTSQFLRSDDVKDDDTGSVRFARRKAHTARLGVRIAAPMSTTVSWKPYLTTGLSQTWTDGSEVRIGQDAHLGTGKTGSAAFVGVGAVGKVTKSLAIFGEVSRQMRIGNGGFNATSGTVGVRYEF